MGLRRQFAAGVFTGAGSVVIKSLFNILLIPILIQTLGPELYGLYVLLVGLIELFLIIDFGLSPSFIKVFSKYRAKNQESKAQKVLGLTHGVYLCFSLLVLLLGCAFLPWFPSVFHLSNYMGDLIFLLLGLVLVETMMTVYTDFYRSVLLAHCHNHWTNIGDTFFCVVGNTFGILMLWGGFGLPGFLVARLVASLLRGIILFYHTLKVEPDLLKYKLTLDKPVFEELFHEGVHAALIRLSVLISHKVDTYVIALFLPLASVSIFEVVFRFLGIVMQVILKMNEGVFPIFSRFLAAKHSFKTRQFFLRISSFNHFISSVLILILVAFYPKLFSFMTAGKIPLSTTWPILLVAIPAFWSSAVQLPATYYLFTSGQQRYLTISSIVTALVNLVLSLILVQKIGLVGVALGTLIPQFVQHQFYLIRKTCWHLKISLRQYLWEVHFKSVLPILLTIIQLIIAVKFQWITAHPLLGFFTVGFIVVTTTSGCWFLLTASQEEKQVVSQKIIFPVLRRFSKTPTKEVSSKVEV